MIHVHKDPDALAEAVASWIVRLSDQAIKKNGRFTIALSGGSTPQKLHSILASSPIVEKIDWTRMHVFWGDERAVPFSDERNNARMAYDTLLNKVPVPPEQVHIMRTDIEPEKSAFEYEQILHQYFDSTPYSFDLVLLGMGDDGHTLSLFPGTQIVHERKAWTKAFFLPSQNMYRISLTAPIANRSAAVAFLVAGSSKSKALREVLEGEFNPDIYPSQIIRPQDGELHWFVDEAAAELVKGVK